MSLRKRYLKTRPVGKVTFRLPAAQAATAPSAHLVGDFNDWDPDATPMRRLRDGAFSVTVDLPRGRRYQFRYLLADGRWANDDQADGTHPSGFPDAVNSVVEV